MYRPQRVVTYINFLPENMD